MSSFSHCFDARKIKEEISIDLKELPFWKERNCGGYPYSHYHWNDENPFEWTLKIYKNNKKEKGDHYLVIGPNFFNNKKLSKQYIKNLAAYYKYCPLFWNLRFIIRVLWKIGLKNIAFLTHLFGTVNEKFLLKPNSVVQLNNFIEAARWNCLSGPNDESMGPRFTPITEAFDLESSFKDISSSKPFEKNIPSVVVTNVSNTNIVSDATKRYYGSLGYQTMACDLSSMITTSQHIGLNKVCVGVVDYDVENKLENAKSFEELLEILEIVFAKI